MTLILKTVPWLSFPPADVVPYSHTPSKASVSPPYGSRPSPPLNECSVTRLSAPTALGLKRNTVPKLYCPPEYVVPYTRPSDAETMRPRTFHPRSVRKSQPSTVGGGGAPIDSSSTTPLYGAVVSSPGASFHRDGSGPFGP